ncbi:MAG: hypothetical protein FJ117_08985 [Deltaproteobacteria bacterium]|nr:hypothetical protein [Deltaproteobacteria bacterium]
MVLFEIVNCRDNVFKVYAVGSSPTRCDLLDFLNELESNYQTNRDGLYALFDQTAEKGIDLIKHKSVPLRKGIFRVSEGDLRVFWFYDQEKIIICTHAIIKKKQKTDKRELDYAIEMKERYFRSKGTKIPIIPYEDQENEKENI